MKLKIITLCTLLLTQNVFAYKLLSHESWTTGNPKNSGFKIIETVSSKNLFSVFGNCAISGFNQQSIQGRVKEEVYVKGWFQYALNNTTQKTQLYVIKLETCLLGSCKYDVLNYQLEPEENMKSSTIQYTSQIFDLPDFYPAWSTISIDGESKMSKLARDEAWIMK
jgi:hypothetical protein